MIASAIFWINAFPPSTSGAGLSDTNGPRQHILGNTVDYKKFFRLQPGEYVQVHQEDEPQNKISINRTVGAIALGPQYIPSTYSHQINDDDGNGTQIDAALTDNEGGEDTVVPDYENNNEKILASDIDPPPKKNSGNRRSGQNWQ